MKVYKFGGASVKDANSVKNVAGILSGLKDEKAIVVVSAMGKTTNSLEKLVHAYFNNSNDTKELLEIIKKFHFTILHELFNEDSHLVFNEIHNTFIEIEWILEEEPNSNYSFIYDQIVSFGEILSSKIISAYLLYSTVNSYFLDVRDCLITDNTYREGKINWELTSKRTLEKTNAIFNFHNLILTQGFIGSTTENYTTTLGREGSDYTAAVFAYILNAEEVVIWKDVAGVLNADPKWMKDAILFKRVSYNEAIELTYYGASVIHPKTIKPLQNKNIPLKVKSFVFPNDEGTVIFGEGSTEPTAPSFIIKENQILISVSAKDFSFIAEDNLSFIFALFANAGIKINLMQNSALSFSAAFDNDFIKTPILIETLKTEFKVLFNESLELLTIRHFNQKTLDEYSANKNIILEQKTRNTAQILYKKN